MRVASIILRVLGYILLAPLIVVAWLSVLRLDYDPQYAAQLIMEFVGPILFVILLIGVAMTFRQWRKSGGKAYLAVWLTVASGALASGITLGTYIGAAAANGIAVNPFRGLWPKLPTLAEAHGSAFVYDRYVGEDAKLYVYQPRPSPSRPAPILVYVHGGGWVQGSNDQRERDLRWLADKGYLVIGVDYALSSSSRHLWDVTQPQIACALTWITRNGERLGGDIHRVAMFGESAGANLVLNVGNRLTDGKLGSRCGGSAPKIGAIISIYPPVDMAKLYAHPAATQYGDAYIGGSPARYPQRYALVSPMTSISPTNPPLLLLTGLDDSLVPVRDTLRYAELAREAGVTVELIAVGRAGHGFDALPGSIGNQIFRGATLRFLSRQGLAP